MASKNTSFNLDDRFEEFVRECVASGRYATASEVIRDALRHLESDARCSEPVSHACQESAADGVIASTRETEEAPLDTDCGSLRGVGKMPGRLLADGTRRGARTARRVTVYLSLKVADELDARGRKHRRSLSEVVDKTLAKAWGVDLDLEPGS